jgi:hypothetical protein
MEDELKDLDVQYKRDKHAILLKYSARNVKRSTADPVRTKELIKQLVLDRATHFTQLKEVDKLKQAIAKIEETIATVSLRMNEVFDNLNYDYPGRCNQCGLPNHEYTVECEELVCYVKPLSHYGNRFWWNVEFTPEEVATICDDDVDISTIFSILKKKNKENPLEPDIIDAVKQKFPDYQ